MDVRFDPHPGALIISTDDQKIEDSRTVTPEPYTQNPKP